MCPFRILVMGEAPLETAYANSLSLTLFEDDVNSVSYLYLE